jgi:hypothetical protein
MIHVILAVIVAFCAIAYMVRLVAGWQPSNRDVMMVLCWILLWVLSLAISPHIKELSNTSHNTQSTPCCRVCGYPLNSQFECVNGSCNYCGR